MSNQFLNIWEKRKEIQPEIMKNWVDNDWAKGRNRSLTFLIKVEDKNIISKIIRIQEMLSVFPCIYTFPKDYFHITVKVCGFLSKTRIHEDDIREDNLSRIIRRAKEILQKFHSFDIYIAKLNILREVVFIEIYDEGKICEINRELQSIPEISRMEFDYPSFLPHISIAQFRNKRDFNELVDSLEKLRNTRFGSVTVSNIKLVLAHLYNSSRPPMLENIFDFKFAS